MDTTKLKPFDLQKALAGDPVVTASGSRVHQIAHFPQSLSDQVVVLLLGDRTTKGYTKDGIYCCNPGDQSMTLFMAPKTKTVWVNLCKNTFGVLGGKAWWNATEKEADEAFNHPSYQDQGPRLGNRAYPIEIEE